MGTLVYPTSDSTELITPLGEESLPEGQPVKIEDFNQALLEAVANKQWLLRGKTTHLRQNEGIDKAWYVASGYVTSESNLSESPIVIDDRSATLSLWRFGDTLYVVTGTPESLTLHQPIRTLEDTQSSQSWIAERIDLTLKPTTSNLTFQLIVLVDGQLYRVADDNSLIPEPSFVPEYPDTWSTYVISVPMS